MYEYIKWEYEDRLDVDIMGSMYNASKIINGVRMYPYVEIEGCRYYLLYESIKE